MIDLKDQLANLSPAKRKLLLERLKKEGALQSKAEQEAPPLRRIPRNNPLPLSFAQQRLWFLAQMDPFNPFYNMAAAVHLTGPLNVGALRASLNEIVRRQESLRTTFHVFEGQPAQVISPFCEHLLPVIDLQHLPEQQRMAEIFRRAEEEARTGFDLSSGPLLLTTLLRSSDEDHVLLVTMHHIISDGWSLGVLTRELGALYDAFSNANRSPLPDLEIQYADFAHWQREWLQGEVLERQLTYWKKRLAGLPTLELPTDHERPAFDRFRGAQHAISIPRAEVDALKELSAREGATLYMALMAAFKVLLYRYTAQEDLPLGTGIANRTQPEIEALIGFFVNTLVIRTDASGQPDFMELLRRVRASALDAFAHQDLPFERLVEELQPERAASHNPLFQVLFVLQNTPPQALELSGLDISFLELENKTAKFDLMLDLWESPTGLSGTIDYNTGLFEASTVARMEGHFRTLIRSIIANPHQPISFLPMLMASELRQLLVEWNDTRSSYPAGQCVHQLFEDQASRRPDSTAIAFAGQELTYAELNGRANQLARHIRSLGIAAESPVGIYMERSPEMIISLLAILKSGGAYVPLDPGLPKQRIAFMLGEGNVSVILTQKHLTGKLPETRAELLCVESDWPLIAGQSADNLSSQIMPDHLAYVMYTSGSTGTPKGVSVTHRAIVRLVKDTNYAALNSTETFLQLAPLAFDASTFEIWGCLLNGARLAIMPPSSPSLADLGAAIEQFQVTTLWLTAALFQQMVEENHGSLRGVRQLLAGGDVLPVRQVQKLIQEIESLRLINGYGPTENTTFTCCHPVTARDRIRKSVPIGRPISNTNVYIVDRYMQPVGAGLTGELYAGGDGLARGYLNRPDLTAERFIPNPFADVPGERLYTTGDLARYLADGRIEFVGRIDNQIKLRGYRIEMSEIEEALSNHPLVRDAVVMARETAQGEKRLAAYVIPESSPDDLPDLETTSGLEFEELPQWESVFEDTYSETSRQHDSTFNITGWNNSYTGEPIPVEEMREWLEDTIAGIASLKPTRVLEIGCGTGLILLRLAQQCEQYWGTDISQNALSYVRQQLSRGGHGYESVSLFRRAAHDFTGWEEERFDAVVLNSTIQYFPSINYLMLVLQQATNLIKPGGFIFIGDVRSLPLLKAYHASVEMYKAEDSLSVDRLKQQVQAKVMQEKELVVDPAFFRSLKNHLPKIERVTIRPKRGHFENELTKFRYQVVLRINDSGAAETDVSWQQGANLQLTDIRAILQQHLAQPIGFTGVSNARLSQERSLVESLDSENSPRTVRELKREVSKKTGGLAIEELERLGEELGYEVFISWARHTEEGSYDVVFSSKRHLRAGGKEEIAAYPEDVNKIKPWRYYANNPSMAKRIRGLGAELRGFLQSALPDYMIPSAFVVMESFPLTENGKLNRRALPEPDSPQSETESDFIPPRTQTETILAGIWLRVLGAERIGINDNFFQLGGHSLLATQVLARAREAFNVALPLRSLFEFPTLEGLAESIDAEIRGGQKIMARPIERAPRDQPLPLSFAQQRLWFLDQLEPDHSFYNIPAAFRLTGALDVSSLRQSLIAIVARHEALRTTFATINGQPFQVIAGDAACPLPVVDITEPPGAEAQVVRLAGLEARRPFDLSQGPLLRATLLQLGEQEHVLLLTFHHIIIDGWSVGIFISEMAKLYEAISNHQTPFLPDLPVQYVDYALWQREHLQGEALQAQLAYWVRQLDAELPALELPTDRPRQAIQSYRGAIHRIAIPAKLVASLRAISQQADATLYMVLLSAFASLLSRYSGQQDIVIGSPVANRARVEIEPLIGFFVNTLVMRSDLSGDPTFGELLRRVREVTLGAYAHQDLPFEKLVEVLEPDRDLSRHPLFQVMFVLQNTDLPEARLPGLEIASLVTEDASAKFDLTLSVWETADALTGWLEYSTDLFDVTTISRMSEHFLVLLEAVASATGQRVSALPILTAAERQQILVSWNHTTTLFGDLSLCESFEAQVDRSPHRIAVAFGEERLTYDELNRRANHLAHYLRGLGIGPGFVVGICVARSAQMLVGVVGIMKSGAAYLPIDPTYPQERLSMMLEEAQPQAILTQRSLKEGLPAEDRAMVICIDDDWQRIASASLLNPAHLTNDDDLAYVIFTSGSTGRPKGVAMNHRCLRNMIYWQTGVSSLPEGARTLQFAPLGFDVSFQEIFSTLLSGGELILIPDDERKDPVKLLGYFEKEAISRLFLPFVALHQLAEAACSRPSMLTELREVITAGEQLRITGPIADLFQRLNGCALINQYGPSESHVVTAFVLGGDATAWPTLPAIGRPIANAEIYILDNNHAPVPVGVAGELFIGGAALASGYVNRPDLSAERFLPSPFSKQPGARMYKTGDLSRYLSDGSVEFLGRNDNQLKVRGFRVEPGEIEAALAGHPMVREALVVLRDDAVGNKHLVAYLVADGAGAPVTGELSGYLREKLPAYMIPSVFVPIEALPVTPSGKVNRNALPAVDLGARPLSDGYVAPRSHTEHAVTAIWGQLLGVEEIGIHDNFFELGGHSLLATQVVSRLRETFAVEVPLQTLFAEPTTAGIAAAIESLRHVQDEPLAPLLKPVARGGDLPLSFAQQRLWFLHQLQPDSSAYNLPIAVRIHGRLDVAALFESVSEIVRRHEALRTTFESVESRQRQRINPARPIPIAVIDLCAMAEAQKEDEISRLAAHEAGRPFDLETGPLVRFILLRSDDDRYVALLTMHHIVSDGWSIGILIKELVALYQALSTGATSPLPELPIQYADFAVWQREWLRDDVIQRQLDYWIRQLETAPPALNLPTDRPRPAIQTFRGTTRGVKFLRTLTDKLRELSFLENVTLFMTLIAGLDVLLWRYTEQTDIVIGAPVASRNRKEIEGLIGFFVNTLGLRADLSGNPSFRQLLRQIKATSIAAYANQDLPFEMMVERLHRERDLSRSPLFQVAFGLQRAAGARLELPGLTFDLIDIETDSAKFDLALMLEETTQGLEGTLEYNTDLFDAETMTRMMNHLQMLMESITAGVNRPISELSLMSEAERSQLLFEWNNTRAEYPEHACAHELFEAQAGLIPDAFAVGAGDEHLSYAELDRRANQLAHYLVRLGVGPEVPVGIFMERSVDMMVAVFATLKAGGAYLPVDISYPKERLAFMLNDARARVVLTQARIAAGLPPDIPHVVSIDAEWEKVSKLSGDKPDCGASADNAAYIIYTSGSMGRPKGVVIQHRSVANLSTALHQAVYTKLPAGPSRVSMNGSLAFDTSVKQIIQLFHGHSLEIIPQEVRLDGEALVSYLRLRGVGVFDCTPSQLAMAVETGLLAAGAPEVILLGGEAIDRTTWQALSATGAKEFYNLYGPTECAVDATLSSVHANPHKPTIGMPLANVAVYLLDACMNPVPVGVPGELYIGGAGLARGYFNQPDMTAERFLPDPFCGERGSRLYRTGDRARYLPDGNIEFIGRVDRQVKVRGYRVELGEIESALNSHPAVSESVVVQEESTASRLIAYLVPHRQYSRVVEGRSRYRLPNNLAVAHLNKNETDFLYKEVFEVQSYLKHNITIADGDCVLDVGANIGLFTLFAHLSARQVSVHAFEPNPYVFELLRLNASLYDVNARLYECGLSDQSKTAEFTFYPNFSFLSGLYTGDEKEVVKSFLRKQEQTDHDYGLLTRDAGQLEQLLEDRFESKSFTVKLTTLSDVIKASNIRRIDLLKINVEKSEMDVLKGIEEGDWAKINQIVMELHDIEGRLEQVTSLMNSHGYRVEVEQDWSLEQTRRSNYYIYARRESGCEESPSAVSGFTSDLRPQTLDAPFLSVSQLQSFMRERLPEHMMPAVFVTLSELPLTSNGKVNYNALPPPSGPADTGVDDSAPQTELGKTITSVWKQVLGVDRVGAHDNFFDLGGHSLLLAQAHRELRRLTGHDFSLIEMFKRPTVNALTIFLSGQQEAVISQEARAVDFQARAQQTADIAIIGMAGRFPGAGNVDEFWRNLRDGVEAISFFTDEELEASGVGPETFAAINYVRAAGTIKDAEMFDARFFGINPREAEIIDPQQRLFLEAAWEAIEAAGYDSETYGGRIGVYGGTSLNSYLLANLYPNRQLLDSVGSLQTLVGNDKDHLTTRVSYKLNLAGPSVNVQTACSSALVAVHMACRSLIDGECEMALAGGVSIRVPRRAGYLYQEGGVYSPDGHCRAFDSDAQGTVAGEGVGVVVLKRLTDALADGDSIQAVLKGTAINNDGSLKVGYTSPSVQGQARVINAAMNAANVRPEHISYIEAHGTGTVLGDSIEIAALKEAFHDSAGKKGFCALGSVKTNIGHLDAAAGIAGLMKTVLSLKHKMIPPSLHCRRPNEQIGSGDSPFYVNRKLTEWRSNGMPRRAGVSSFGIGGTNAHVIVEEAPETVWAETARPAHLLVLSARTKSSLQTAIKNLTEYLKAGDCSGVADIAYTLQLGRRSFEHRMAFACDDLADALRTLTSQDQTRVIGSVQEDKDRPVVFMFPGQGSQYVNMGRGLYEVEPLFRGLVDYCSKRLEPSLGFDLRGILFPPETFVEEASRLINQTQVAQPALFVIEYALAKQLIEWGIKPSAMIGHSIGEYVAACLSGVFSLEDALSLIAARGRLMQEMPAGAMLAVLASEERLKPYLNAQLSVASVNAPELCVISGPTEAIEAARNRLNESHISHRQLHTSHAFHSHMMEPVLGSFRDELEGMKLNPPKIPYISNVTGNWATISEATDPDYWVAHLRRAVRFSDGVRQLMRDAESVMVEVGPGQSLCTLAAQHVSNGSHRHIFASTRRAQDDDIDYKSLLGLLGRLFLAGVQINWQALYSGERRSRVSLPTYAFERERFWIEANPQNDKRDAPANNEERLKEFADWFYIPVWKQSGRPAFTDAARGLSCLIFLDDCGIGAKLARQLEASGCEVLTVSKGQRFANLTPDAYTIDPHHPEDYERLFKDLSAQNKEPQKIIHLWTVTPDDDRAEAIDGYEESQLLGFHSLLFIAQAHGKGACDIRIVSNNMHEITGEQRARSEKATLLGPCLVIPQEYPDITCCSIDITLPQPESSAEGKLLKQLAEEVYATSADAIVAYRNNRRWVRSFDSVNLPDSETPSARLRDEGVYVITGGTGDIALELAYYLARERRAKLALVSRSAFPVEAEWDSWLSVHNDDMSRKISRLRAIKEAGSKMLIIQADVTNEAEMRQAIGDIKKQLGPINGVIHAAGVAGGGMIEVKQPDRADHVLAPKVKGALVLDRLLEGENLDFLILFSSQAAILGGFGQVDYCGANAFLDAFANRAAYAGDRLTISINWCAWKEVGMAANTRVPDDLSRWREEEVEKGLLTSEGLRAFNKILDYESPQMIVSPQDFHRTLEKAKRLTSSDFEAELERMTREKPAHSRPDQSVPYVAPSSETERIITEIWQQLLGFEQLGVQDNFFELGGHSLLALQVLSRLKQVFDLELSPRLLFDSPTPASLALSIEGLLSSAQGRTLPALTAIDHKGRIELSYAQQRLWFVNQLSPHSNSYNIPILVSLEGPLNSEALSRAYSGVISRHETLRTRYVTEAGTPYQVIEPATEVSLPLVDLSYLDESRAREEADNVSRQEMGRALDLEAGPVMRGKLIKVSEQEHELVIVLHHIAADGWSVGILLDDLCSLYEAAEAGVAARLPSVTVQYADYAIWQRRLLEEGLLEGELRYWKRQLEGVEKMELPTDLPRPRVQRHVGGAESFTVGEELTGRVKRLCVAEGATLYMGLLAAYCVMLVRYSRGEEAVIGTPIANRGDEQRRAMVGMLVNTVVMRVKVREEGSYKEMLKEVKRVAASAYENQEVPFEKVVEELKMERGASENPVFQVGFVMQNQPRVKEEVKRLRVIGKEVKTGGAKFDISLTMKEEGDSLEGVIEYDADLFFPSTITEMIKHYESLLASIVNDPDAKISNLLMTSEDEIGQLVNSFNMELES